MSTDIKHQIEQLGSQARQASRLMAIATRSEKDGVLVAIADALEGSAETLVAANQLDLQAARDNGLDEALIDRLALTDKTIAGMAEGCRQVASLPDPIGEINEMNYRPSGIQVGKMRVPLGVIGIIYESRPNVTIDAAALCIKSGNASILRGGSEAIHSNRAIASCIAVVLAKSTLPDFAVQLIDTTDRAAVGRLIAMPEFVDVIVPRGGKSLIERISNDAEVPVIKHLDGICHVYIDQHADPVKAYNIALNSKTHRYGVCNAMETLLVHKSVAEQVLPELISALQSKGVEIRACDRVRALIYSDSVIAATQDDWDTEYLAPILAVRIVDDCHQAVAHINQHGSAHTDCIVSENFSLARRFLAEVDSASVMINASTRFADGFEYGLGAEIGISTDKLHARGPVGLEGLTSQKYVVFGDGHIRA